MDALLREKLTQLTSKCEILQKNGKFVECIDIMQQIVTIKKNVYGIDHAEFQKASEKLCEYLNLAAMVQLQKQNLQLTLDYLRKAELVARNSFSLKSTTYNNLACYYRRTGKIRTALSYLIQALELELKIDQPKTLADTHLNLCAVLSQLDRHDDALQHSMLSIILLQDQFLTNLLSHYHNLNQNHIQNHQNEQETDVVNAERLAILAIAYHNLGVQFQHLKRFDQALKIYRKALKFSKDNLSTNQQLIRNLTRVVNSATEQIQEQKKSIIELKGIKGRKDSSMDSRIDLYKDLTKKVQRYRNLPKIKFNSKEHNSLLSSYSPNFQSIDNAAYNTHQQVSDLLKQVQKNHKNKFKNNKLQQTPENRIQLDSQLKVRNQMNKTFTNHEKD